MAARASQRNSGAFFVIACLAASAILVTHWRDHDPIRRLSTTGRVIEARLTAFDYSALQITRSQPVVTKSTDTAYRELEARLTNERTPDNLHRFALAKLAISQHRSAKQLLNEALTLRADDASILADLGAVELALDELHNAAEHSAHALEIDPDQQSAAFNWALAIEKLSNRPAAIEAWERYLRLDGVSGWSDEARQHLNRLRAPRSTWEKDRDLLRAGASEATVESVVRRFPQRSRVRAQEILLPSWIGSGRAEALTLLRTMGAIRAELGDPFLRDVVEHAVANRVGVAEGLMAFTAARAADAKVDMETAGVSYRQSAALLHAAGSPLAIAASVYAASTDNYAGRLEDALTRLQQIDSWLAEGGNRYPSMAAEAGWVRGLVHMRAGRPNDSLESFRAALGEAHRAGELEDEASITALMATQLESVADPAEAERFRTDALRRLDELNAESRRMYVGYLETGTMALRARRPRLALAFLDAALGVGRAEHNAMYVADCNAWRALALVDIGRTDAAASAIAAARRDVLLIQTPGFRERTLGNIDFITSRVNAKANPALAIAAYTAALERWNRDKWRMHIAAGYLARGETFLTMGNRAAAERDFRLSIAEIEKQRGNLTEPDMRISYFERADTVFLRLIEVLLEDGRVEEALSVAERKRARALLDQLALSNNSTPLDAHSIAAAVDGRTSLLEVVLLDRGPELWLVHGGRVFHGRGTAPRHEIEETVRQHLAAIAANDLLAVRRHGRWLFDQLLAPVAGAIPADSDLVIVADAELQSFPFATLVTADGAYLIDRQPLAVAPSATLFLRQKTAAPADASVLGVAQPAPEGFMPLPRAAAEVAEITRTYARRRLLIGPECSPAEFLAAADDATLVYFGGHARTDVYQSARSALIFQAADGAPSELTAAMIGKSRLPMHPLIVLAACSTGRGKTRRNEGIESLASAFLQAGARGVVGTLWDVEDASASELFRTFHHRLRDGARPADALREAQRSCMHSTLPELRAPSVWASAVVTGTF